jgi:BirA family biotin operon repressor/biotin-[acetyl-CoA-carboxylase] ligase
MDRGQNLIFTILLRYPAYAAIPPALTLKTGLAVSLALEDFAPPLLGQIRVKWPNDLMILDKGGEGRKAGGILTETEGPLVYAGIGVNLAQREFPKELRDKAVSLLTALEDWGAGPAFPPPADPAEGPFAGAPRRLLEKILPRLWEELEGAPEPWKPRLEERLYRRGEPVTFAEGPAGPGRITKGRLAGIGEGGELLIVPEGAGEPRPFITGELRVY